MKRERVILLLSELAKADGSNWPADQVFDDEDRVYVNLYGEPDLLAMLSLLGTLKILGASSVRMETWECGTSEDCVFGPRLVVVL